MTEDRHWLERPATIAWLWRGGYAVLALTVLGEFTYHAHAYFEMDGWFAFHAAYGFMTCVAMVLLAKLLGVYLKRREDYYEET